MKTEEIKQTAEAKALKRIPVPPYHESVYTTLRRDAELIREGYAQAIIDTYQEGIDESAKTMAIDFALFSRGKEATEAMNCGHSLEMIFEIFNSPKEK